MIRLKIYRGYDRKYTKGRANIPARFYERGFLEVGEPVPEDAYVVRLDCDDVTVIDKLLAQKTNGH